MQKLLISLYVLAALGSVANSAAAQDAAAGEKIASSCIGCHGIPGYQASFPEVHKVPMISGQNAKYIVNALTAYKKGDRKHPTMRGVAAALSDKDMANLAAFYEQQPKDMAALPDQSGTAPSPEVAELLKRANCASCHGVNFSKPIDPSYPRLAGQHADYLYVALKAYQTDNNPQVGRNNAIMSGMSRQYSHAELKKIAGYIGSLDGSLRTVAQSRLR